MKITAFGADAGSWNCGAWNSGPDDDGSGNPGVTLFGNALSVWALCQEHYPSVDEAALAFNVAPDLIREAVEADHWMFINVDGKIEHDGE